MRLRPSIAIVALGASLGIPAAAVAAPPSDAQMRYQQERAACDSGRSYQDQATCLKEAGAAYEEAQARAVSMTAARSTSRTPSRDALSCRRRSAARATRACRARARRAAASRAAGSTASSSRARSRAESGPSSDAGARSDRAQ